MYIFFTYLFTFYTSIFINNLAIYNPNDCQQKEPQYQELLYLNLSPVLFEFTHEQALLILISK
jgi:hypothetical protein